MNVQLCRACRLLSCQWRAVRGLSSETDTSQDVHTNVSETISRQILQSGFNFLKQGDIETLKENARQRAAPVDFEKLVEMNASHKQLLKNAQELRHRRNLIAKWCFSAKSDTEKEKLVREGTEVKHKIAKLEEEKLELEMKMMPELSLIPNNTHPDCPVGGYEVCKVVREGGLKREFGFPVENHAELGERLGIIEFSAAAKVSGTSFYFLKGATAALEIALVQYAMQKAIAKGYVPVITPDIVRTNLMEGCGFQPRGVASHVYHVSSTHSLVGTAEIPLAAMYMNSCLPLEKLPVRHVAFGHCFRKEAGGTGAATRGLYRVHQFSKVELFALSACETGEESEQLLRDMIDFQTELLEELGLCYRVLEMSSEELGAPAYRKFDVEVWMPGHGCYGEVTSASNCTDYQSRRLQIKYLNPKAKPKASRRSYVHTINGTACAVPRILLSLMENYQQEDGSIVLPQVLHPFLPAQYHSIGPD